MRCLCDGFNGMTEELPLPVVDKTTRRIIDSPVFQTDPHEVKKTIVKIMQGNDVIERDWC